MRTFNFNPGYGKALLVLLYCLFLSCSTTEKSQSEEKAKIKVLIIDGQNNHIHWPKTTAMMKTYLEQTDLFSVDVDRPRFGWKGEEYIEEYGLETPIEILDDPKPDSLFAPDFSNYDVVLSNFGWRASAWSASTKLALEEFVKSGGGLAIIHAANNSWPEWLEFNKMIGLGGWGDRTEKDGPYVYFNNEGEFIMDDTIGRAGSHGPQHEFTITVRDFNHPITSGMPENWKHAQDELYDRLRGPAENLTVLGSAYSSLEMEGTDRHEPMIMALNYGKGRVFHTPMGHSDLSMSCVGFITTLQRGIEWSATGGVTQELPEDFPTLEKISVRAFK